MFTGPDHQLFVLEAGVPPSLYLGDRFGIALIVWLVTQEKIKNRAGFGFHGLELMIPDPPPQFRSPDLIQTESRNVPK